MFRSRVDAQELFRLAELETAAGLECEERSRRARDRVNSVRWAGKASRHYRESIEYMTCAIAQRNVFTRLWYRVRRGWLASLADAYAEYGTGPGAGR